MFKQEISKYKGKQYNPNQGRIPSKFQDTVPYVFGYQEMSGTKSHVLLNLKTYD